MKIQCPHCGVKGSADESYRGQKVKCPKCQGIFEAVAAISKVSPEDMLQPASYAEKPAEPSVPISGELPKDRQEKNERQADGMEDNVAAASGLLNGDLAEPVVAEELPENERPQREASAKSSGAEKEDVLHWQDIVAEIDKEMAEDSKRGKEDEGSPAILHDFFESAVPVVDDLGKPVVEQRGEDSVENDRPVGDEPWAIAEPPISSSLAEEQGVEKIVLDGVENQPYGMDKEQCWQCGKKDSIGVPFIAKDGRLYCPDCLPPEKLEDDDLRAISQGAVREGTGYTDSSPREARYDFTIGGLLKEAWSKTKGAKATVWAGSSVMYLVLIILVAGGTFLLPSQGNQDVGISIVGMLGNVLIQMITNAVSVIFSAGLLFIGIRKVAGETINWKMIFEGFSVAGKLIVATILQTLLVGIGFLLLILPGIYLAIGYAMTVPLIVDRKMSPWQAMEASRKAIHGEWWKIFGLFIVMGIIFMISSLPLGLGLIWSWPMFVVLGGVVYRALFGVEKRVG